MNDLVQKIAEELTINTSHAHSAIKLLFDEACTIPFVARYRKEVTGSMDELQLRALRDRYTYLSELESTKIRYIKVVEEHCKNKPELLAKLAQLQKQFQACQTKQELEDLYLPFKPKRRTRAQIAKEKGLAPLLDAILEQRASLQDLTALAQVYVTASDAGLEPGLEVASASAALAGAADILAEQIHENAAYRQLVRSISNDTGMLLAQKIETLGTDKGRSDRKSAAADLASGAMSALDAHANLALKKKKAADPSKYENYYDYRESINTAVSHRIMAVRRGEAEKVLRVSIEVDNDRILRSLEKVIIAAEPTSAAVASWLSVCIQDAYRRLIAPSIETEIRLFLKNKAEEDAIKVFSTNLENLLMLPPIPGKVVMGIDPGIRTGSKLAVIAETGKLLAYQTIYPSHDNLDSPKTQEAMRILADLIKTHNVAFIAIGNGTGSREIDQVVIRVIKDHQLQTKRLVVNEAGASVYSTDDIAREEFPDLDPTIRSAVSIGRRLQDPLAELVKVDPRSIGVGQYQHDCNVTKLNSSLTETVESSVNKVGVNVNTASYKLLSYVSGIGPALARNIVAYRDTNGTFTGRENFKKVSGFGPKAFEQAAGFLRIVGAENPLDNSSVHPERYPVVEKIADDLKTQLGDLIGKKEVIEAIALERYVNDEIGLPTLLDIAKELVKPGRDPREDGSRLTFSEHVSSIGDLKIGMKLKGTVSNVTNFGAFVDIGVHQDGLVHISELSDSFVKDPASVVAVGAVLDVYVLDVDLQRKRISLSCKLGQQQSAGQRTQQSAGQRTQQSAGQRTQQPRAQQQTANAAQPSHSQQGSQSRSGQGSRSDYQRSDSRGDGNRSRPGASSSAPRNVPSSSDRSGRDHQPRPAHAGQGEDSRHRQQNPRRSNQAAKSAKQFSVDDLLNKFNTRS